MNGKVFINYRRGDDSGFAQALFGRLEQAFPREQLFMDVDNIEPGLDFVRVLAEQVAQCDVLISVIGKNWIGASDGTGARRLDNPDDFVRIEIESALAQDKRVIPVLVGQASMPRAEELPESMRPLVRRHAVRLTHERFRADAEALIAAVRRALDSAEDARRTAADEERLRREAEAQAERAAVQHLPEHTEAKRPAEEEEPDRLRRSHAGRLRPPSRTVLALLAVVMLGVIGVWFALSPTPVPTPPAPAKPAPVAVAPLLATAAPLTSEQERTVKPGDMFRECANCPDMVVIRTGSFLMGSPADELGRQSQEDPQHGVTFAGEFAVGQFAVTFDEWDACAADGGCNGYKPSDQGWGRGRRPVINVSWDDAQAYVAWLAKKTGKSYRLPSEAEREYVTRAGTATPFWWGASISSDQANYNARYAYGNGEKGLYRGRTMAVDSFQPNPWRLFQVHGNVWEWVEDCAHGDYRGAPLDGSAWATADCPAHMLRGGSWDRKPEFLRSASRLAWSRSVRDNSFGFRVARMLIEQARP
jgi:formylglycine-generating enzyme required for sulfatase activity